MIYSAPKITIKYDNIFLFIVDINTNPLSLTNYDKVSINYFGSLTCSITSIEHTTSNYFIFLYNNSSAVV